LRIARNTAIDHLRTLHEHEPLEEAAEATADKAAEAYSKVIDDWCRETGLTQR